MGGWGSARPARPRGAPALQASTRAWSLGMALALRAMAGMPSTVWVGVRSESHRGRGPPQEAAPVRRSRPAPSPWPSGTRTATRPQASPRASTSRTRHGCSCPRRGRGTSSRTRRRRPSTHRPGRPGPGPGRLAGARARLGLGALEAPRTAARRKSVQYGQTYCATASHPSSVKPTIFRACTRHPGVLVPRPVLVTVMKPRSTSSWPSGLKASSKVMPATRSPSLRWSQCRSALTRSKSWTSSWKTPCQWSFPCSGIASGRWEPTTSIFLNMNGARRRPVPRVDPLRHLLEGGVGVELGVDPGAREVADLHLLHRAGVLPDEGDLLGVQGLPGGRRVEGNPPRGRVVEVRQELVGVDSPVPDDGLGETAVLRLRRVTVGEAVTRQVVEHGEAHGVRDLVLGGVREGAQRLRRRHWPQLGKGGGRACLTEVTGTREEADVRVLGRDGTVPIAHLGVLSCQPTSPSLSRRPDHHAWVVLRRRLGAVYGRGCRPGKGFRRSEAWRVSVEVVAHEERLSAVHPCLANVQVRSAVQ